MNPELTIKILGSPARIFTKKKKEKKSKQKDEKHKYTKIHLKKQEKQRKNMQNHPSFLTMRQVYETHIQFK